MAPAQHFTDHRLGAQLGSQVDLLQIVLIHEETQYLSAFGIRQRGMLAFIVCNQLAQQFERIGFSKALFRANYNPKAPPDACGLVFEGG